MSYRTALLAICLLACCVPEVGAADTSKPVKVFILAGQSKDIDILVWLAAALA